MPQTLRLASAIVGGSEHSVFSRRPIPRQCQWDMAVVGYRRSPNHASRRARFDISPPPPHHGCSWHFRGTPDRGSGDQRPPISYHVLSTPLRARRMASLGAGAGAGREGEEWGSPSHLREPSREYPPRLRCVSPLFRPEAFPR